MTGARRQECEQRDTAVGWALHALEPEEEAGFAMHLPHCADCADRVRATEAMAAVLGGGVMQLDPPPRLRAAILAAASSPQLTRAPLPQRRLEVIPASSSASVPRFARTRRVLVAAAAVGALAFGAGWAGNALLQPTSGGTTQSALPQLSDPSVHRTALTEQGTGQVVAVVLTDASGASVVPVAMRAAATGDAYWLWGTGSGKPVPLGKVVLGSGAAARLVPQGAAPAPDRFGGYAVSVERDTGVPAAPSTIVATSGTI